MPRWLKLLLSALCNGLITFFTAVLASLQDGGTISQAALLIAGAGSALAFLKDCQSYLSAPPCPPKVLRKKTPSRLSVDAHGKPPGGPPP
jgi:hypothetical protein